ncbi:unnamed protein product [Cylicocyclus nassatus]|uniref:Choline/ethanolamine kinase n=1 Tax=Cylicocyclus nassatus TaxID=53992 RepID=A0AA36M793_CYLNA|nr:unnamed protein product [Cylicocyclus nassatus]
MDLRRRILALCANVLGEDWANVKARNVNVVRMRGLTNLVYIVSRERLSPEDKNDAVVLRIQSQTDYEKLINELVVLMTLAESGLGPKLLGVFPGGRFEQYIPSRHLQHHEVTDSRNCVLLARLLPRFHSATVPVSKQPSLLHMMREWLALFGKQGTSSIQMETTSFQLPANTFPSTLSLDDIAREIDLVEEFLSTSTSPIVFCHNDLTSGNLLLSSHSANDPKFSIDDDAAPTLADIAANRTTSRDVSLSLVDFEFSGYNYRGFDLANYFCAAAIEHIRHDFPHYHINVGKLQDHHVMLKFCKEYVTRAKELNISIKSENNLLWEIEQFMPVVHLFWAIFNLYCEKDTLAIMDCAAYARDRLALFYHSREALEAAH